MGNRAVITNEEMKVGVYVHWNGGRDSVEAFLTYCKMRGFRSGDYGFARLCQVIGNYFGGALSVGIDAYDNLDTDNWGNGVYVVRNWEIVDRLYMRHEEQYVYDLNDMLKEIDEKQPEDERLGEYLDAVEIPTSEVKIGDTVFMFDIDENVRPYKVIGFGTHDAVNGRGFLGKPYVDRYCNEQDAALWGFENGYEVNCNNYIRTETCRVLR